MKNLTRAELFTMVINWEATDEICDLTKRPIFAEQEMYRLFGEHLHHSVDIDKEIEALTNGDYKTSEELYNDDSDDFYFTNHDDNETILQSIIDQEYFYDAEGNKQEFTLIEEEAKPTTNREFLMAHFEDMDDEQIDFLYKLFSLKFASKHDILKFCGEGDRNYDTAYPIDYFRQIEAIYPNIKDGDFIYDYTEDRISGRLVNIYDIFAKTVLRFISKA